MSSRTDLKTHLDAAGLDAAGIGAIRYTIPANKPTGRFGVLVVTTAGFTPSAAVNGWANANSVLLLTNLEEFDDAELHLEELLPPVVAAIEAHGSYAVVSGDRDVFADAWHGYRIVTGRETTTL